MQAGHGPVMLRQIAFASLRMYPALLGLFLHGSMQLPEPQVDSLVSTSAHHTTTCTIYIGQPGLRVFAYLGN